jgi:hypothetical protein
MSTKHPELSGTPEENITVQILNPGSTKILFRVVQTVPKTIPDVMDKIPLLQDFHSFTWKEYAHPATTVNAQLVSPWLMRTGWQLHLEGKSPKAIEELVKLPSATEYPGFYTQVLEHFEKATDLFNDTNEFVLQEINMVDPNKM